MDPLSITASAAALAQVAGCIIKSLHRLVRSLRTVDSRLSSLCDELGNLTGYLDAVGQTLSGYRRLDLALVENELWNQCSLALADCQLTLNELSGLVAKINGRSSKKFARRARIAVDLNLLGSELAATRDKLQKSNCALQTMLQTLTVSLSIQNHASQGEILLELDRLKVSIDEAFRVSMLPLGGLYANRRDGTDARVTRNLCKLAHAAKVFHSAASWSASSMGGSTTPGAPLSLLGDFPPHRRERVEQFIESFEDEPISEEQSAAAEEPIQRRPSTATAGPAAASDPGDPSPGEDAGFAEEDEFDQEDDDQESERIRLSVLQDCATDCMRSHAFDEAVHFFQLAIDHVTALATQNGDLQRLKSQLAVCHFLRGEWKLAAPIVTELAESKSGSSSVAANLLHALSLAHVSESELPEAFEMCKKAVQCKKRMVKLRDRPTIVLADYGETLGLLAHICELKGELIWAETYRRQLPAGFKYSHPASEVHFIHGHATLLRAVLGFDLGESPGASVAPSGVQELEASMNRAVDRIFRFNSVHKDGIPALRRRIALHEWSKKQALATQQSGGQSPDADDEASVFSFDPECSRRRNLARIITFKKPSSGDLRGLREEATSPTSPGSPLSRWFKGGMRFRHRKSKTLLRKDRDHNPVAGTFPLMTSWTPYNTADSPNGHRIISWMAGLLTGQEGNMSTLARRDTASSALSVGSAALIAGPRFRERQPGSSNIEISGYYGPGSPTVDATCDSLSMLAIWNDQPGRPVELADTMVTCPAELADTSGIIPELEASTSSLDRNSFNSPATYSSSPSDARAAAALSVGRDDQDGQHTTHGYYGPRDYMVGQIDAGPFDDEFSQFDPDGYRAVNSPAAPIQNHSDPCRPRQPAKANVPEQIPLDSVLRQVANIVASLPSIVDPRGRLAARHKLESLRPKVNALSSDHVLGHDLARIIRSLAESECQARPASDSGFESMEGSSTKGDAGSQGDSSATSTPSELNLQGQDTSGSYEFQARTGTLSRRFSWKAGSESRYTRAAYRR